MIKSPVRGVLRHFLFPVVAASLLAGAPAALAHDDGHHHAGSEAAAAAGDIAVAGAWARAMLPGQPSGGGYLTITNAGNEPDRLLAAASPAAGRVEIHTMEVVDDVMTMRPLADGLEIAPGESVELAPGGLHLMFFEVVAPFAEGETVPVTLRFERAGGVEVAFPVRGRGQDGCGGHDH